MEQDDKKRGYLLPEGCKDLIDILKPLAPGGLGWAFPASPAALPTLGEITVAERMTVRELAALLKQTPSQISGDMLELGVYAKLEQPIPFEIIVEVVRRYGYKARRVV